MQNSTPQYLTERECAALTKFSVQTLRNNRFMRCGIPYRKCGPSGRSVRYRMDQVIAYMEKNVIDPEETR